MVTVIAAYRITPEAADAAADLLARHAAASEQEPGCRQFRVHRALDDPTRFFLYESYDSDAAFTAHRRSVHFRRNIEQTLAPLLVEREWHACSEPLRMPFG